MNDIQLASKLPEVGTTIFSVMSSLANEYDAVNLSQGFPNFPVDSRLKDAVIRSLQDEQVQYAPMGGRPDLRHAIAEKILKHRGLKVDPDREITVTAGATEAIYSTIAAVVSPGDEVIMFDPAYDCYDPAVRLNGGKPVHLTLTFPEFSIDWKAVRAVINSRTKLIVVNNPHNPAGSVWKEDDIGELERLCRSYPDVLVLSDEVYEHIQFEGEHCSVLDNEFLRSRSFAVYSFGKTFHVTGWKIGYCVAPAVLTSELRKAHQYNVFCVNNTMQAGLARYLEQVDEWQNVAGFYRQKRDLFLKGMSTSRFRALGCQGTYFCLFDYSRISDLPDTQFAEWMTIEHKVAAIPVSVFYRDLTDHKVVRFCFAKTEEMLNQALEKLCRI